MQIPAADRKLLASLAALVALSFGLQAHAQFTAPTCVPPNCSPAVIQNILLTGVTQNAGINISGDAKLGATLQVGATAPVMSTAAQNLIYGNVGAASSAGGLMLLQNGAVDRLRITLTGQELLPLGTLALPSYSFLGDTNTGIYQSAADTINFVTGGVSRLLVDAAGGVTVPGTLAVTGSFSAASFTGVGSALTSLNAANIASGLLNDARLSANVALLAGMQTFTGAKTFSSVANSFAGSGAGLTSLNASNLSSGSLPDARLSANVPLLGAANTFTSNTTLAGMSTFGSAGLAVGAAQNLLYGNIDTASTGSLLLLQNESVDRFRVDAAGNVTAAGNLTVAGQSVCRANGTNCPATVTIVGTPNYITKFTGSGNTVGNSLLQDNGTNIGVGGVSTGFDLMTVYGSLYAKGLVTGYTAGTNAGYFQSTNANGIGVTGTASGYGVYGFTTTAGGNGVYGSNGGGGGGSGVTGFSNGTYGVQGIATSLTTSQGVYGSGYDAGVYGIGNLRGVVGETYGTNINNYGVTGKVYAGSLGSGVAGITTTGGNGVYGVSNGSGDGVYGLTNSTGNGGEFKTSTANGTGLLAIGSGAGKAIVAIGDVELRSGLTVVGPIALGNAVANLTTVNGSMNFAGGGGTYFSLPNSASQPSAANGRMYYDTGLNKFRCQESGVWKDCIPPGGVGGSGTTNYLAKFTPNGTTLGSSLIFDNGTSVGIGTTTPNAPLEITPTGNNWNEGMVINPSTTGGWNDINFRQTVGSITASWLVGRNGTNNDFTVMKNGLVGMIGTWRNDVPFEVTTTGNSLFGGSVGIGTSAPVRKFVIESGNGDGITIGQTADDNQVIQTYLNGQWANRSSYAGGCCNKLALQPDVGEVGVGTSNPLTKFQVLGGTTLMNHLGNNPQTANYAGADLVLGDNATTRDGMNGTNGSNLFLQSSDKSSISALDENNNLGQISYQNLQWNIGENVGWGPQSIYMPGTVGVGTAPLSYYGLSANGTSAGGKFMNSSTGNYALLGGTSSGLYISVWTGASGNSSNYGGNIYVCCGTSSNTGLYIYAGGPNNNGLVISNGGAQKPGGGGFNNYASDRRTKRDVTDFNDGLDVIRKIHPVNYYYNGLASTTDDGTRFVGLIAQDVQSFAPHMVGTRKDFLHKGDKEQTDILTLDSSDLTYIEANAIKTLDLVITDFKAEVQKKNAEQDARIDALEKEVQALKDALRAH